MFSKSSISSPSILSQWQNKKGSTTKASHKKRSSCPASQSLSYSRSILPCYFFCSGSGMRPIEKRSVSTVTGEANGQSRLSLMKFLGLEMSKDKDCFRISGASKESWRPPKRPSWKLKELTPKMSLRSKSLLVRSNLAIHGFKLKIRRIKMIRQRDSSINAENSKSAQRRQSRLRNKHPGGY